MNVTAFENGFGAGVLIRAVEPVSVAGIPDHASAGIVPRSGSCGTVEGVKAADDTSSRSRMEDIGMDDSAGSVADGNDLAAPDVALRNDASADDGGASSNIESFVARRRPGRRVRDSFNGPAKLCKTLGIDMDLYDHDLREPPLRLESAPLRPGECVEATERIGITKAKDRMRRFVIAGNPYLSR